MSALRGAGRCRSCGWRASLASLLILVVVGSPGLAAVVVAPSGSGGGGAPRGTSVSAVELRSDTPLGREVERLRELIGIEPGQAYDPESVRRALRNLAATGVAGEIEAYGVREADGIRLVFALWSRVRVEQVVLEGELELKERELRRVLVQQAGEPLVESRVVRSVFALQELYSSRGWLGARVRVGVDVDEVRKLATVTYRIDPGPTTRVERVRFEGEWQPLTEAELREPLRMTGESRYLPASTRDEAERLQQALIGRGYRTAGVEFVDAELDDRSASAVLTYRVELGPLVRVTVRGAKQSELEKRDLLPFTGPQGYDEALLLQAIDRIRRHYQERGHYQVEVERQVEESEDRLDLTLAIDPGATFTLVSLRFTGNESFTADRLSELMATGERRTLVPGSGHLVDAVLSEDLRNLRTFYALQGFANAQIGPPQIAIQPRDQISLTVPIQEGQRQRVADVRLEGVEALPVDDLKAALPLEAGGPFHPWHLQDAIDIVRSRYESAGYREIRVSSALQWNADRTLANVTLHVLEGPLVTVDRVIVRGADRTDPEVIVRSVGLAPGDPISTQRLLDVQRRLYSLGIFSSVEVTAAPGTPFSPQRDVYIRVREGQNRRVSYGFGWDSEAGVRGLFGLGHSNLLGRALSARFDANVSDIDEELRLLARQPFVGPLPWPVTASLFKVTERHEGFISERRGAQTQVERLGRHVTTGILYTYRVVDVLPPEDGEFSGVFDPDIEDRELRDVAIASVTPSLQVDHRDDPIDPQRGWNGLMQLERAFPLFAADEEFLKLFTQATGYVPLDDWGVLAGSVRFGGIEPLVGLGRDPLVPPELPSSGVPISERFFAGGRSTHRAYDRDELGIPGTTLLVDEESGERQAVGGNGLLLFNLDWRFPLVGPVEGLTFVDAGNVWADWRDLDPAEAKLGAGVGVRYRSPIGPLRLEIGWKLDRLEGEDPYRVFLSFGNPF